MLTVLPEIADVRQTSDGYEIRLIAGSDPATAIRRIAGAVALARIELSRVRLEDVFIRLVSEGTATGEAERVLRADLQGLGTEGAAV